MLLAADDRPVAFVEIGDALRPWRDRKRVGPKIVFALAIADRERRTHARADDQIGWSRNRNAIANAP